MLQLGRGSEVTKVNGFTGKKVLFTIAYALVLQAVIVLFLGVVLGTSVSYLKTAQGKLITNVINATTFIVSVAVIYNPKKAYKSLFGGGLTIKIVKQAVLWGLVTFSLSALTNVLTNFIYGLLSITPKAQSATLMLEGLPKNYTALAILLVVVIAPFFEELVFRGLLQKTISNYAGAVAAIVSTGVLFAFSHFDLYQLPGLIVMGLCYSYSHYKTKTLYVPAISHMMNNLIFIVLFIVTK